MGSILEKCGNFLKTSHFSGWIWPDWGNTAWADMARLGSIGLKPVVFAGYLWLPKVTIIAAMV